MGGRKKNGLWRGEETPTDHSRQGGFGRGMRIATGAERPRNDMVFTRGAVRRRDTWVPPYNRFFVGQGPCALPGVRYGIGGRPQGSPLRRVTRSAVRGKNPPVTASPRQPPLGKGAQGTGMRIATTSLRTGLAMTRFIMGESHLVGGGLCPWEEEMHVSDPAGGG